MKLVLPVLFLLIIQVTALAQIPRYQKLSAAEYFINNDPGVGNGIPISGNYGYWEVEVNVPDVNLPVGSVLYIRFKSTNGKWSSPRAIKRKEYFVNKNANIQYVEYYINNDPGKGNGAQVDFSNGFSLISHLKLKRDDKVFVRARDNFFRWSPSKPVQFKFKNILRAEYYVKLGSGGNTAINQMNVSLPSDSSCVFVATKDDIAWHNTDTAFVRFVSTDRFIGRWTKGPLIDPTSVRELNDNIPKTFILSQNYPNPFNPSTVIEYGVPKPSFINIIIFDILGKKMMTVVCEEKQPGFYKIPLEMSTSHFSSGIYFYQLRSNDFTETKKMLLIR